MPISAFVVRVPAAEPMVRDLRAQHDAATALGVPAHITVLVPFMDPAQLGDAVLARARTALEGVPAFAFVFDRVGRFPETAYLAPTPAQPFIAMTQALVAAFPGFLPYGGAHADVVPHLSVAHGDASTAQSVGRTLAARLLAAGPVRAACTEVVLIENASGTWRDFHVFKLPSSGG